MGKHKPANWEIRANVYRNGRFVGMVWSGLYEDSYGEEIRDAIAYSVECGITEELREIEGYYKPTEQEHQR